jgi:hypothetical protein
VIAGGNFHYQIFFAKAEKCSTRLPHSCPPFLRDCDVDQPRNLANFVTVD